MGVWVSPEATASIRAHDGRVQLLVRTQADEELVASAVRAFAHELG